MLIATAMAKISLVSLPLLKKSGCFTKGLKMRLLYWLAKSATIVPTVGLNSSSRWRNELRGSLDDYARAANLPQPQVAKMPAPPRLKFYEDAPVVQAYAYQISKYSWHGAWTGGIAGAAGGAYLACIWAPEAVLVVSLAASLVGVGIGFYLLACVTHTVCRWHKRSLDRRAEKFVARLYCTLDGGTESTIRQAMRVLSDDESHPFPMSRGRRALVKRVLVQLSEISQNLIRKYEDARRDILIEAKKKQQRAANSVISDAIAGTMLDGPTYARQQIQACARMFSSNDDITATLREYADEMESALTARQLIGLASAYLAHHTDDAAHALVVRGLRHWRAEHPLINSTQNGRRLIDARIQTLLDMPGSMPGITYAADKKSAQLLLQSAPAMAPEITQNLHMEAQQP